MTTTTTQTHDGCTPMTAPRPDLQIPGWGWVGYDSYGAVQSSGLPRPAGDAMPGWLPTHAPANSRAVEFAFLRGLPDAEVIALATGAGIREQIIASICAEEERATEEAESIRGAIVEALYLMSGEGVTVESRHGSQSYPERGALLHYEPAVADHGRVEWYPTPAAAMAALHALAVKEGVCVEGQRIDFTHPGCAASVARVVTVEAAAAH